MELEGKIVLLGIVERVVAAPVEVAAVALYGTPLRLVLRRHLIPEFVILRYTAPSIHLIAGCNVAQELVGICRQLRAGRRDGQGTE